MRPEVSAVDDIPPAPSTDKTFQLTSEKSSTANRTPLRSATAIPTESSCALEKIGAMRRANSSIVAECPPRLGLRLHFPPRA